MAKLIKKYLLLLIASYIGAHLLTILLFKSNPDIMIFQDQSGGVISFAAKYLKFLLEYLFNLILVVFMLTDTKQEKVKTIPIYILTILNGYMGILFFILSKYATNSIQKQINHYDTILQSDK